MERLRREALRGEMDVDLAAYRDAGLEVSEPVLLGSGSLDAELGIFGRDPGRLELVHREPFIGKGGQLIRDGLHRAARGASCPDLAASVEVGRGVFWGNTVPFKPTGNKAWSVKVKRRFLPIIRDLLVDEWRGRTLITCGNVAFEWFGLADPALKPRLKEFWARPDRYEAPLDLDFFGKALRLLPLPHPSPLNATWFKRFPALLDARLRQVGWP